MHRPQRLATLAAAALAAASLGACTGAQDPSQAGFLDGVGNLATGTYDRRIEEREVAAANANAQADSLARRAQELEAERQMLAAEEAAARSRLQRVNAQIYQEQQRLTTLRSAQNVDQIQLAQLEDQVARLQAELRQAQSGEGPRDEAEIARLEREIQELRSLIDGMMRTAAVVE